MTLRRLAACILILALFSASAGAQSLPGDLIVGFEATAGTGNTTNLEVDIGSASNFANALSSGTYNIVNLNADLDSTYGSWSSDPNLSFAIVGATEVGQGAAGAPKESLWASGPTGTPGSAYSNSGGLANKSANAAFTGIYSTGNNPGGFGGIQTVNLTDITGTSVTLGSRTITLEGLTAPTSSSGSFSNSSAQTGNWFIPFASASQLFTSTGGIASKGAATTEVFYSSGQATSGSTAPDIQAANGDYSYFSLNPNGELTFTVVAPQTTSPSGGSQLINISTRSEVGAGADLQIAGFVIEGSQPKTVLIRASGPALAGFDVAGALADPTVALFSGMTMIAQNTGWGSAGNASAIETTAADVHAFSWASGSADSAILITLQPGAYTAQVGSASGGTGVALAEVYDCDPPNPDSVLKNISTRSLVQTAAGIQIAGFVITGSQPKTVLIRASGPALTAFAVSGVLPDPTLTLLTGQTVIATNTGWGTASNALAITAAAASVSAFPWPTGSADSAILITLQPGSYTAQVSGASGDTGVALVEVYDAD